MKILATQDNLQHALNLVSRVASARTTLPILSHILIHSEKTSLYLTTTNLEMAIRVRLSGKVQEGGRVTVPARLMADFVSSLPKGNIEITSAGQHAIHLSMDHYQSTINGADPEDYPSIPEIVQGQEVVIPALKLKRALQQTIIAASHDGSRQILTGIYLKTIDGYLYAVATDSYRLAERRIIATKAEASHIVPASTMQELLRILPDSDQKISVTLSEAQAVFTIDEVVIVSRLIEGKFPDYRQIIPATSEVSAKLDREEFISITKVSSLFARESAGSVTLTVSDKEKEVQINTVASQVGDTTTSAVATTKGSGEVSLNSRYLLDALQSIDSTEVRFRFSGKHNPCIIEPVESKPEYLHVVMPLKA